MDEPPQKRIKKDPYQQGPSEGMLIPNHLIQVSLLLFSIKSPQLFLNIFLKTFHEFFRKKLKKKKLNFNPKILSLK